MTAILKLAPAALEHAHADLEFQYVSKFQLVIPKDEYQRDESEGRIAARIAADFNVVAFGALLVIKRPDGAMIVADGGTRLSAALQRPEIETVPCLVFSGLTKDQEGKVFMLVNLNRCKLDTAEQHHAELYTGNKQAREAQQLIDAMRQARVHFDGLHTMRSAVRSHHSAITQVVQILIEVAADKHVSARMMKGLVTLEVILNKHGKTLKRRDVIGKIRERLHQFDVVLNALVATRGRGDPTELARGIAKLISVRFPVPGQKA